MTTRFKSDIPTSEITSKEIFLSRRDFIKTAGFMGLGAILAACAPNTTAGTAATSPAPGIAPVDIPNTFEDITNYNNYYEFSTDKTAVNSLSKDFVARPWTVEVGGLVNKPKTYDVDELIKKFQPEERIYRLRCVEAWSMVIPWNGFSLSKLLNEVEPTSKAKYVSFESLYDTQRYPGQKSPFYPWPYQEGLRLDEAMNDLAILATGLYGETLPNPNGAPIRLVTPWKYGFKSIKGIIKIELVEEQPATLWSSVSPNEYGFYSNVNPNVSHPRWTQSNERRIGELARRPTLMFNGYEEQVASLYAGMDLKANY